VTGRVPTRSSAAIALPTGKVECETTQGGADEEAIVMVPAKPG
jgi:hypothetical protein